MSCDTTGNKVDVKEGRGEGSLGANGGVGWGRKIRFNSGVLGDYDVVVKGGVIQFCTSPVLKTTVWENGVISNSAVSNVVLHSDSKITDSIVRSSYVMSHTSIIDAALILSSILGPDSHYGSGETHCSLLGPNTVAHHQSLCISHISPGGRTNLGYGANAGSNHTGRLPDAEFWNGEGVFIGLAAVVKFSCDLSRSYYTLVAAGTVVNSGVVVTAPFSLVTSNGNGDTEVRPGWVVYSSPYTIARAVGKFKNRSKAAGHKWYSKRNVLRAGIMEGCRREIEGAGGGRGAKVVKREKGVKAYEDLCKMVCLEGLLEKVENGSVNVWDGGGIANPMKESAVYPWNDTVDEWEYQRFLLGTFYRAGTGIRGMMEDLVEIHGEFVEGVERSKKRDDRKGRFITGYEDVHPRAEDDKVVKEWKGRDGEIRRRVKIVSKRYVSKL